MARGLQLHLIEFMACDKGSPGPSLYSLQENKMERIE
jgi:hypothetical protein